MDRTFPDFSIGGAVHIDHLDLTAEEAATIDQLSEQALVEEDLSDMYGDDFVHPDWFGKQHSATPMSKHPIVPKGDFKSHVPSRGDSYKIRKMDWEKK